MNNTITFSDLNRFDYIKQDGDKMKKIYIITAIFALLAVNLFSGDADNNYVKGNVIIQLNSYMKIINREPELETDKTWFNNMISIWDITDVKHIGAKITPEPYKQDYLFYTVVFDTTHTVEDLQNAFTAKSEVITTEPNYLLSLHGISTDDEYANDMWGLEKIEMNRVWSELEQFGDEEVTVAVVDTGTDLGVIPENPNMEIHEDLKDNIWENEDEIAGNGDDDDGNGITDDIFGYNPFYDFDNAQDGESINIPQDFYGHGTHVIGTVAASTNNNTGVAGVAGGWYETGNESNGCKVMALRVGGTRDDDPLILDDILSALTYAYINKAQVINCSWGGDADSPALEAIINTILNDDCDLWPDGFEPLIVASAGNDGTNESQYPAAYDNVITVAATDFSDRKASYSQYGYGYVDVCAPGGDGNVKIISSLPEDSLFYLTQNANLTPEYDGMNGTSMAAPHVAGLIALMKSYFPNKTNDELIQRLYGTTDDIYGKNMDYLDKLGAGRINAFKALNPNETSHPTLRCKHTMISGDTNSNGIFECGETADLTIIIKNWWADAENVTGTVTTTDPNITITNGDNLVFGDIENGNTAMTTFSLSDNFDNSIPRKYELKLTLNMDNYSSMDLYINLNIYANVGEPWVNIMHQINEKAITEMTFGDIDNNGKDEIALASYNSNNQTSTIYLYKEDRWNSVTLQQPDSITCKLSFADLDEDGFKEIIAGGSSGYITIWDKDLNQISGMQTNSEIYSFAVEDVNNNGTMDIVGIGNGIGDAPNRLFAFFDVLINLTDITLDIGDADDEIISEISVANVDEYPGREAVFIHHKVDEDQHTAQLKVVRFTGQRGQGINIENGDFWNNGSDVFKEMNASNIILIKPQFEPPNEVYYHRIYFSLGTRIISSGSDSGVSHNKVYCFDSLNLTEPFWIQDGEYLFTNQNPEQIKLIAGEFDDDEGLEIIKSDYELILDVENGEILDHVFDDLSWTVPHNYTTMCLTNIDNSNSNDLVLKKHNKVKVMSSDKDEIKYLRMMFPYEFFSIKSISIGNSPNINQDYLYILVENGELFRVPINTNENNDWEQYQNNARNTGSYFQPIPTDVEEEIEINHDVIIDEKIAVKKTGEIKINQGNILRLDKGTILEIMGNLIIEGTDNYPVKIRGLCADNRTDFWRGMKFFNASGSGIQPSICDIKYADISNAYRCLDFYDTGNRSVKYSDIHHNSYGINSYNSYVKLRQNNIHSNSISGITCFHNGNTSMGYSTENGQNAINDNGVGIYVDHSYPTIIDGHNDFDNRTFNISVTNNQFNIPARHNWWGSIDPNIIESMFSPVSAIDYDPYDSSPNTDFRGNRDSLIVFNQAVSALYNENFIQARELFANIINDQEENNLDYAAIQYLYYCHHQLNTIGSYLSFLEQQLQNNSWSGYFIKVINDHIAMGNRTEANFNDAIQYYENIVENAPSYEDSCYAVIDIGNTYLQAGNRANGRLLQLRPTSREDHLRNTDLLLESIRTGIPIENNDNPSINNVKPSISNNYPNPFNPVTTIKFSIPEKSTVDLCIYNIKGQKVKTLINETLKSGNHNVKWHGVNNNDKQVSTGIYFYKFKVNGKTHAIKKCLLLK